MSGKPIPIEQRFWNKVDKRSDNECWVWNGATTPTGYGKIFYQQRYEYAHRVSYLLYSGSPVPSGKEIHHFCNNKSCVNPRHLIVTTHAHNMAEMFLSGSHPVGEQWQRSHLTDSDIQTIRQLHSTGEYSHLQLADMFGTTRTNIGCIVRRETWKHIP